MTRPDDAWVVCFGWDVGGWMGRKHGAAAVAWQPDTGAIEWLGAPARFRLSGCWLPFLDFVAHAAGHGDLSILGDARIVVGIDAPLGYPAAYRRLVAGESIRPGGFERELDNAFAYRRTERHIHETFSKKALSAPFDKLGNNASVAISHARQWSAQDELRILPFQAATAAANVIIEVYPALAKKSGGEVATELARFMPAAVEAGTDPYDAAICALTALAFAADGAIEGLPRVRAATEDMPEIRSEGWIYYMDGLGQSSTRV